MAEKTKHMTEEEKKDNQYERLIAARNFHYDNLNKWLMTFYVIIGALFVALYHLHGKGEYQVLEIFVAIVGYVVSIGAFLSGKGYYYWETNWIMLIHHFEKKYMKKSRDKFAYRTYSVFANKNVNNDLKSISSGANISTTKIALLMTYVIAIMWGALVMYLIVYLFPYAILREAWCQLVVGLVTIFVSYFITRVTIGKTPKRYQSNLEGLDDLELFVK